jgi:pimeloyl-ACP methyl ester carboxylesterase
VKPFAYYRSTRSGCFSSSSGASLRYTRFGDGPEVVVVIPGIDDAIQNLHALPWFWAWYFRPLVERGRSVFLISRARGLPETLRIADLAEIYAEVIERHIGPAHLLGISMGGMIAQHIAVNQPHLVRRLILAVTAHRLAEAGHTRGQELMKLASAGRWHAFLKLSNALCFSGALRQLVALALWFFAPLALVLERRGRRSPRRRAALDFCSSANACAAHDTEQVLSRIKAPTLIWGAKADLLFPSASLECMARLLPEARLVTIDGAHAAFLQRRSRFQRSVADFLGLPADGGQR